MREGKGGKQKEDSWYDRYTIKFEIFSSAFTIGNLKVLIIST